MNFLGFATLVMALVFGFLLGMFVQAKYLAPPPIVYHTAPVIVQPASQSCVEQARICYARKRSSAVQ